MSKVAASNTRVTATGCGYSFCICKRNNRTAHLFSIKNLSGFGE
jgi:hypothetical protein